MDNSYEEACLTGIRPIPRHGDETSTSSSNGNEADSDRGPSANGISPDETRAHRAPSVVERSASVPNGRMSTIYESIDDVAPETPPRRTRASSEHCPNTMQVTMVTASAANAPSARIREMQQTLLATRPTRDVTGCHPYYRSDTTPDMPDIESGILEIDYSKRGSRPVSTRSITKSNAAEGAEVYATLENLKPILRPDFEHVQQHNRFRQTEPGTRLPPVLDDSDGYFATRNTRDRSSVSPEPRVNEVYRRAADPELTSRYHDEHGDVQKSINDLRSNRQIYRGENLMVTNNSVDNHDNVSRTKKSPSTPREHRVLTTHTTLVNTHSVYDRIHLQNSSDRKCSRNNISEPFKCETALAADAIQEEGVYDVLNHGFSAFRSRRQSAESSVEVPKPSETERVAYDVEGERIKDLTYSKCCPSAKPRFKINELHPDLQRSTSVPNHASPVYFTLEPLDNNKEFDTNNVATPPTPREHGNSGSENSTHCHRPFKRSQSLPCSAHTDDDEVRIPKSKNRQKWHKFQYRRQDSRRSQRRRGSVFEIPGLDNDMINDDLEY